MTWSWGAVQAPKEGLEEATYEDSYQVALDDSEALSFRAAISDGATESAFSRLWADLLTRAFVEHRSSKRDLAALSRAWAAEVWSRDLPWNVQAKASNGAHASLLGAIIRSRPDGRWRASMTIIGDSCAFAISEDGRLKRAVPYTRPDDFDRRPYLLSTDPVHRNRGLQHRRLARVRFGPNDHLLLCTDAVGRWILGAEREQLIRLVSIADSSNREHFDRWFVEERAAERLNDDDSTVVVISRG